MKGTMTMKRPDAPFIFIAGAMLTLFTGPRLAAATYDLKADWSDSANPNGPWAYKEGNNLLPHVNAWQSGDFATAQPAWARAGSGNTIIPAWFKSSGTLGSPSHYDWLEGDIVIHTADDAHGVGSGPGNVTWTSPLAGFINISGAVWIGRDIGRSNHWTLSKNGVTLTTGDVFSGDIHSRASPFHFANGTGGASVLANVPVNVGDVIKLQLERTSVYGDYIGVNLTVELTSAPQGPSPVVNCATTAVYAHVTDPIKLAFAPDGALFVGRDNVGSGGSAGDAVKIHRVAPGGSPVTEYGDAAIADPDAVAYDALGIVSGTPGAVLVGGGLPGGSAAISKINTNGDASTLFGGAQTNIRNPGELLFDAAGRLYISDLDSNQVLTAFSPAAPTKLFSLAGAYTMVFDASNRLAVGSISDGVLRYYSTNGVLLGTGPNIKPGSSMVAGPGDPFWGRDLYAVAGNDQLIRIDSSGSTTVVGYGFDGSLQMAFGPDQALYVSCRDYDVILRIAPAITTAPTPVHWWRGEGNALDSIGTAHGITNNALTYGPGRFGQAFRADGTAGTVVEFYNTLNFLRDDFTIAFWLKTTSTNLMTALSKREGCNADSIWDINNFASGAGMGLNEGPGLYNYFTISATNVVADNQWHHLAFVRSGATLQYYLDAVLRRERTTNFVTLLSNSAPVRIGNMACAPFNPTMVPFQGQMDEIQIFNCALSAVQIAAAAGLPDPTPPRLNIAALGNNSARLSWNTNAIGFTLQSTDSLSPTNWVNAPSGTNNPATVPATLPARFYRLFKP